MSVLRKGNWVRQPIEDYDYHRLQWDYDGVPWNQAPQPPRRHRCQAQTVRLIWFRYLDYCACGGFRGDDHWWSRWRWYDRNTRPCVHYETGCAIITKP